MRILMLTAMLGLIAGSQPDGAPVPIVVELFTSEGCSSCPPADALLSRLSKDQPVPGVQVIPLGMHVTYWDQLGWKDPASDARATARQQHYSEIFGADRMYTPQAVIDGRAEVIGSDEAGVKRAVARAAKQPRARVSLASSFDGNALVAEIAIAGLPPELKEPLDALLIVTEDGLTTVVKRGENGGRTLHHDAVVRAMFPVGAVTGPREMRPRAVLDPDWRRDRLHVVLLLQGKKTQRIWGAALADVK